MIDRLIRKGSDMTHVPNGRYMTAYPLASQCWRSNHRTQLVNRRPESCAESSNIASLATTPSGFEDCCVCMSSHVYARSNGSTSSPSMPRWYAEKHSSLKPGQPPPHQLKGAQNCIMASQSVTSWVVEPGTDAVSQYRRWLACCQQAPVGMRSLQDLEHRPGPVGRDLDAPPAPEAAVPPKVPHCPVPLAGHP